jgi:uncharacterized protein (DUF433 family)
MTVDLYGGRDPLHIPNYTVPHAAHMSGVPVSTLRSWLKGYTTSGRFGIRRFDPLIDFEEPESRLLTFTNVLEAHILASLRHIHGVPMQNIRPALDWVKSELKVEHPLTKRIFETNGVDLFVKKMNLLINASRRGQIAIKEFMEAYLTRIVYDESGLAYRLFPLYRRHMNLVEIIEEPKIVMVDPRVSFGRTIVKGIPTASIASLFKAGDDIDIIAYEYGLKNKEVQEALRYEQIVQKAA